MTVKGGIIVLTAKSKQRIGLAGPLLNFHYMRLLLLAIINLRQAAFAGFPEAVVEIDAGLVHSAAYHVIADVPGAGEEIAEVAGVHGPVGSCA